MILECFLNLINPNLILRRLKYFLILTKSEAQNIIEMLTKTERRIMQLQSQPIFNLSSASPQQSLKVQQIQERIKMMHSLKISVLFQKLDSKGYYSNININITKDPMFTTTNCATRKSYKKQMAQTRIMRLNKK